MGPTEKPATSSEDLGNIGEDGRRFRIFIGILLCCFSLGFTALVTVTDSPLPLRAAVFLPLVVGINCLLQARGST